MIANFWWLLTIICLVWYSTVTVYVGVRGARDIQNMLARLDQTREADEDNQASP